MNCLEILVTSLVIFQANPRTRKRKSLQLLLRQMTICSLINQQLVSCDFFKICFTLMNLLNIVNDLMDTHSQKNACCLINAYSTILSFLRRHSLINTPCLLASPVTITLEFLEKAKRSKIIHVVYFLRNLSPETALRSKPNFEESLQGSKLVNNLEIMLKNDQTIIEFGFRMMRRIIQMEENIWGGKQPLKSV